MSFIKIAGKSQIFYQNETIKKLETPEEKLFAAVMIRAILDLKCTDKAIKRDAKKWFSAKDNTPMSFLWICENLKIDPQNLLKKLYFSYTKTVLHLLRKCNH